MGDSLQSLILLVFLIVSVIVVVWVRSKVRVCFRSLSSIQGQLGKLREENLKSRVEVARLIKQLNLFECRVAVPERSRLPLLRSQFGEDLVLLQFFGTERPGFYIEAGGYDGLTFSATAVLEALGWRGLLVEPHPQLFLQCRDNRPGASTVQAALGAPGERGNVEFTCVDYAEGCGSPLSFRTEFADHEHVDRCRSEGASFQTTNVPVITLNEALHSLTDRVDLLVLDIEGHELRVLEGFDLGKYRPAVVLVEIHWNQEDNVLRDWFGRRGYQSCGVIGCNEFFAPAGEAQTLRKLIAVFPDC